MSRTQWLKSWVSPKILPTMFGGMVTTAAWLVAFGRNSASAEAARENELKRVEMLAIDGDRETRRIARDDNLQLKGLFQDIDRKIDKRLSVTETSVDGRLSNIETSVSRLERGLEKNTDALGRLAELIANGGKRP